MGTTFGDLLRAHRRRARLTQEELADGSGVSVRAISDMERGRARGPQRRTVEALAGVLALAPAELDALAAAAKRGRARRQPEVAPCALPPDVSDLTGRDHALAALGEVVAGPGATSVVVVHGPPGAGKTSLAVRAGYRFGPRFADGCFFFDLRGMDTRPVHPAEVVHRVLLALGVQRPPGSEAERSDLYRELLRTRSTMLVLDNAADEAQVRPLLATGRGSLVLVTSRQVLGGLAAVARLGLDVLDRDASVALLGAIAGPARVAAERGAAQEVARLCGHLPLALRIAGNRLAGRPKWTVGHLAGQLADERRRLTALTSGDLQVRTAFEMSYRQLAAKAASLFRRLSVVPGATFTPDLAAVVAGVDRHEAEDTLEELVDASLLDTAETPGRYAFHDLIRVFAGERLVDEEPDHDDTRRRLVSWLIGTAVAAAGFFGPDARATPTGSLRDKDDAGAWLAAETGNWLGALRWAGAHGMHRAVLDLATAVHWYSDQRGRGETWAEVFTAGVAAARALGSVRDEAVQLNFLTWTRCVLLRDPERALALHADAWRAAVAAGDVKEQAWAVHYRAASEMRAGDLDSARDSAIRARELFRAADYPLGEQISSSCLGLVLHALHRYEEAAAVHRALLETVRAGRLDLSPVMADEMQASLLVRTAESLAELGRWAEVRVAATEALHHAVAATAPGSACDARYLLGLARYRLGDAVGARADLVAAAASVDERRPHRASAVLGLLADVLDELGDPAAAVRCRERAAGSRSADR
ncbi:XRE family transcriptional regulator [Saccharothrix obliqua]|uniref:XRE family transcriptional regulator n=1 Tax=Saccharothrix obliqua TaxID=2861747 RepID=UPI001C5FE201|nr:XRE family transcriptional regulator [Saccharothrix obliqua]MBW4719870.1 helix-turn-helix domain-containing protein [Saccharothrix obliqua]